MDPWLQLLPNTQLGHSSGYPILPAWTIVSQCRQREVSSMVAGVDALLGAGRPPGTSVWGAVHRRIAEANRPNSPAIRRRTRLLFVWHFVGHGSAVRFLVCSGHRRPSGVCIDTENHLSRYDCSDV